MRRLSDFILEGSRKLRIALELQMLIKGSKKLSKLEFNLIIRLSMIMEIRLHYKIRMMSGKGQE